MQRSRYQQLAFDIVSTVSGLLKNGHAVAFQWILARGIPGNESADAAAIGGHNAVTHVDIPFATTYAEVITQKIGHAIAKAWWNDSSLVLA